MIFFKRKIFFLVLINLIVLVNCNHAMSSGFISLTMLNYISRSIRNIDRKSIEETKGLVNFLENKYEDLSYLDMAGSLLQKLNPKHFSSIVTKIKNIKNKIDLSNLGVDHKQRIIIFSFIKRLYIFKKIYNYEQSIIIDGRTYTLSKS